MRLFPPPIPAAVVAVTLVAGLASYQGVDKLVLAKGGPTYGTTGEPGHEPSSSGTTSTTVHHERGPTTSTTSPTTASTSTTTHHEPYPSTSTTIHHEPYPSTSTPIHHEPYPSTSTTIHHEPTPPLTAPPTTTAPTPAVTPMSFYCMSGFSKTVGVSKCSWAQSTAPHFGHYRLTRELVGTPRQTIFESTDQTVWYYYDIGLQADAQYSYIVETYDTAGNLIARGGPIHLTCCGGTATT